jgi:REP element-mobilizing transposase RayT
MGYIPGVHHRRSIRLKGYDYTRPGAYFITIVTHHRQRLFGRILHRRMRLTPFGEIALEAWLQTVLHQPAVALDAFVVMPDHFHGIVIIRDGRVGDDAARTTDRRGTACRASVADIDIRTAHRAPIDTTERFGRPVPGSIPTIVRSFKSAVTKRINERRGTPGAPVWQRNYWERIIRDEFAFGRIRRYIIANPTRGP